MNDQEYLAKAGIDAETGGAPAPATESTEPQTASAAQQAQVEMFEINGNKYPVTTEFPVNHNGAVNKVPYSTMMNGYRQFLHVQPKHMELTKKLEGYKDFDKYKGFHDKYGQIQEWSEQNPDDWSTLYKMFENRNQHLLESKIGSPGEAQTESQSAFNAQPLVEKIAQLEKQIGDLSGVASKYQTYEQKQQEAQDVSAVKVEIETFSKEFPEINMEERDPDGIALWAKIVQYGLENNYTEFTPAAMMFLKQQIADTYMGRARKEAMGAVKQDNKNGVVKRSATPFSGQGQGASQQNIKNMSYSEIAEMAKQGAFASGT